MHYNIPVIYGSVRHHRQGIRAARYVLHKCRERNFQVTFVDPMEYDLPMLDRMFKEYDEGEAPEPILGLAEIMQQADGYIIVSGEYNHSIPPALSNLLDHYLEEYFFKPSGIVCYSAGSFGGVRAAIQLRAMLAEMGMSSIPSIMPVPKVKEAFQKDGTPKDNAYEERLKRFLDEFEWYVDALAKAREKGTPY